MKTVKQYIAVILIIIAALILVAYRLTGNKFRPDAEKWAGASFSGINIIDSSDISALKKEILFISLDETKSIPGSIIIRPGQIIQKENTRRIRNHEGPVVLHSGNRSVAAATWMVLSQIGIRNIYILSEEDDELLKYKFRPDSIIRPEL